MMHTRQRQTLMGIVGMVSLALLGSPTPLSAQQQGSHFQVEIPATTMKPMGESPEDVQEQALSWFMRPRPEPLTLHGHLAVGSIKAAEQQQAPAKSTISIPSTGTYHVWVRYAIHPLRAKPFTVQAQGNVAAFAYQPYGGSPDEELGMPESDPNIDWNALEQWKLDRSEIYGDRPVENQMIWTRREIPLQAGSCDITLAVTPRNELSKGVISHPPEVDSIIITNDASFEP